MGVLVRDLGRVVIIVNSVFKFLIFGKLFFFVFRRGCLVVVVGVCCWGGGGGVFLDYNSVIINIVGWVEFFRVF